MTARTSNSADRYCVHYKLFFGVLYWKISTATTAEISYVNSNHKTVSTSNYYNQRDL